MLGEQANLRCPRNGKRPRPSTQAGSGAFCVQVSHADAGHCA